MTVPEPDWTASLAEMAAWIRQMRPIVGATATEEDCKVRRALVEHVVRTRTVWHGDYQWHTAQLSDGTIAGVSANSCEEAELSISVWRAVDCIWVVRDAHLDVFHEYFPRGKRSTADANTVFPVGPPRRPRDQFAPAESLMTALTSPAVTTSGSGRGMR